MEDATTARRRAKDLGVIIAIQMITAMIIGVDVTRVANLHTGRKQRQAKHTRWHTV